MNWKELAIKAEFKELIRVAGEEAFSEEDKLAIIERVKDKLKNHGVSDSHADNLILEGGDDNEEDAEVVASASSKVAASIIAEEESISDLGFAEDTEITSDNIDQIMDHFKGVAQEGKKEDNSADEIIKSLDDVFDKIKLFVDSLGSGSKDSDDKLEGEDKKKEASLKSAEKSILSDFIVDELVRSAKRFEYQSELDRYIRDHPDAERLDHSYDKKGEPGKGRPRNSKLWDTKNQMESYLEKHPKADKTKHQYKNDGGKSKSPEDEGKGRKPSRDERLNKTREKIKENKKLLNKKDETEDKAPSGESVAENPERQEEVRKKIEEIKENAEAEKSGEKPSSDLEDSHVERDVPHWFDKNDKIDPLNDQQMKKKGFNKGSSELKDDDVFFDVRTGKAHKFSELPEKVKEKLMEKSANNELWHSRERNNRKDKPSKKTKKEKSPKTEVTIAPTLFTDQVDGLKKDLSKNIIDNEQEIRDTMVDNGKVIGDLFNKFREKRNKEVSERNEDKLNDVLFDKNDEAYHFDKPKPESDGGMLPSSRKPKVHDTVRMKSQKGKGPGWNVEKVEGDTAFLRNDRSDQVIQSPLNQLEFVPEKEELSILPDKMHAPKKNKKMTMKDFLRDVPNEDAITDKERKVIEKLFKVPERKKESPKKDLVEKVTDKIAPAEKKKIDKIDKKVKELENKPVDLNNEDHTEIEKLHHEKKMLQSPKEETKAKPPVGNSRRVKPNGGARPKKDLVENITDKIAPKKEAPKKESPKKESPEKESPEKESPKKEAPKKEDPKKETPKKETPKLKKKLSPDGEERRNVLEERVKSIDKEIEDTKDEIEQNEEIGLFDEARPLRDRVEDLQTTRRNVNKAINNLGKAAPKKEEKGLVEKITDKIVPKKKTPKEESPKEESPKKIVPKKKAPKEESPKEESPKKIVPKKKAPKEESPKEEEKGLVEKITDKIAPKKENSFKDFAETLDPKTVSKIRNTYGDGVNDYISDYLESNNIKLDSKQQDGLWERVDSLGMEDIGSGSYNEQNSLERIEDRLPSIVDTITKPKKVEPKKDLVEKLTDKVAPKGGKSPTNDTKGPPSQWKLDPNNEPKDGPEQTFHFGNKQ